MCKLSYGVKMEGYEEGRFEILKRMIEKDYSDNNMLELGYTKEDIDEVKELLM